MNNFFGTPNTRIMFAADLPTYDGNARILDQVSDAIDVIKINCPLVYREGLRVISRLQDRFQRPVFADLKVGDVPHTNAAIVALARDAGAAAIMVHAFTGPDGIEAAIEASQQKLGIICQIELTNPGGKIFNAPISNDMAKLAGSCRIFGVQAPGNRPDRIAAIREIVGPERTIVCCGVGAQGGNYGKVINSGGSYAIIGRAIYNAPDPAKAVHAILNDDKRFQTISKPKKRK